MFSSRGITSDSGSGRAAANSLKRSSPSAVQGLGQAERDVGDVLGRSDSMWAMSATAARAGKSSR